MSPWMMGVQDQTTSGRRGWPQQGWMGLLLIAIFWPLNWVLPGSRTAYLFFPLWLGYILTMDGLVWRRLGSSMLTRSPRAFCLQFVVSAPAWWLFEVINRRTANWEYQGSQAFDGLEYGVLCSVSFSTVMPAVFGSAEWIRSWPWMDRFRQGPRVPSTRAVHWGMLVSGLVMLGLTLGWPRWCYPLVWCSVVFILEPVNLWLGRPHLLEPLQAGDWRPILSLSLGALLCGFFWELWNVYSCPKWVYHTPGAEFLYVFEMPLLGYGGYLFFAWELFELRSLLWPGAPRLRI